MAPPKTVADMPSPTPSAQPHSLSPSDIVVTRDLAGTAASSTQRSTAGNKQNQQNYQNN